MTEAAAHIRHLFLDPKDTYSAAEAADILGIEPQDLKNLMESGELDGIRTCCGMKLPRKELISFALERLAERDGQSVDDVLARELLDLISAESDYLAPKIPGFTAALRWPQ